MGIVLQEAGGVLPGSDRCVLLQGLQLAQIQHLPGLVDAGTEIGLQLAALFCKALPQLLPAVGQLLLELLFAQLQLDARLLSLGHSLAEQRQLADGDNGIGQHDDGQHDGDDLPGQDGDAVQQALRGRVQPENDQIGRDTPPQAVG